MKKTLLVSIFSVGTAASALAQGYLVFENQLANGSITIGPNTGPPSYAAAGTYTVSLLWSPGTSFVPQSALVQIATYGPTGSGIYSGFFRDPNYVYTPPETAGGRPAIFEVQGWIGNYSSYADAVAAGAYAGQTAEFINGTGNPNGVPPTPPENTTGWDGNLILVVPEPGTLALGGFGVTAWLYFRRRK